MVHLRGVEPPAHALGGHCSIRLSYRCMISAYESLYMRYLLLYEFYINVSLLSNGFTKMQRIKLMICDMI